MPRETILAARDLSIDLCREGAGTASGFAPIVTSVSFAIAAGSIVGLVGESGCGKTTLALALLKLLPAPRYRVRGSVRVREREILSLGEKELEPIRGAEISMIFQDPLLALNPVMRVGDQVAEVARAHRAGRNAGDAATGWAGLPKCLLHAYPHQLSGGERQRVLIAQALACRPAVVIADEPFTALDPPRVVELASLFCRLKQNLGTSFLVISHSPGVLARIADEVLVMHAGRIVRRGTPREAFRPHAN